MNWLDWAIIATIIVGGFLGLRIGFIRAAFTTLGVMACVLWAGQVTDGATNWIARYLSDETLARSLGYALTVSTSAIVAFTAGDVVRRCLNVGLLGWTDRLAGLALGSATGVAISVAAIIGMAGLAYSVEVSNEMQGELHVEKVFQVSQAREKLAESLARSTLVPALVDFINSFPESDLDFVPSKFRVAADSLSAKGN